MNEFKESLKVEREKSGEIIITESLRKLLIELMRGNISKKEVMEKTGIGDKGTVELKIQTIVAQNPELQPLYDEYFSRKSKNFDGYEFRAEAIEMLRMDLSQTDMAKRLGVSRRAFSTKIQQLQEKNSDNALGALLKAHSFRKERKRRLTAEEAVAMHMALDKYEEQYPIGTTRYEERSPLEVRREHLQSVLSLIQGLRQEGVTLKELDERKIISESNYRKYKLELDALSKILDDKQEKEQ